MDPNGQIIKLLSFYAALGRPLTLLEIWRLLPPSKRPSSFSEFVCLLDDIEKDGRIVNLEGFFTLPGSDSSSFKRRSQDFLLDQKWKKFLKFQYLFSFIPFIDFVLGAGSLALGNIHRDSDFDVIVGCQRGRIFTVRFFSILLLDLLGIRRKLVSKNKICLNHFITPASYKLRPPHNFYWQKLYQNLVPIFGKADLVCQFFEENNWVGRKTFISNDKYWQLQRLNPVRSILEFSLNGSFGDTVEKLLKKAQIKRIEKNFNTGVLYVGHNPRLRYDDEELELHLDTSRIENYLSPIV